VLDPADEVGDEALGLAREREIGNAGDQLREDQPQLHAREVRAQAVVRAAAAERDLGVG
jgi:hypothetical protein